MKKQLIIVLLAVVFVFSLSFAYAATLEFGTAAFTVNVEDEILDIVGKNIHLKVDGYGNILKEQWIEIAPNVEPGYGISYTNATVLFGTTSVVTTKKKATPRKWKEVKVGLNLFKLSWDEEDNYLEVISEDRIDSRILHFKVYTCGEVKQRIWNDITFKKGGTK